MKTIYFNKFAIPVSDFDIETAFMYMKDNDNIFINNILLLYRFILGFLNKEIETFQVILTDIVGNIIEETISVNCDLYNILNSKLFSNEEKICSEQLLFERFVLGVYKEEIVPFSSCFELEEIVNVEYFYNFDKVYNTSFLSTKFKLISSIWESIAKRKLIT